MESFQQKNKEYSFDETQSFVSSFFSHIKSNSLFFFMSEYKAVFFFLSLSETEIM
jgi:hypothetical protein